MAEEQGRQFWQAEKAGRHTGEPIEGEIQVHQLKKAGKGHGQRGQEAGKRVTLCIIKTVSWNQREAVEVYVLDNKKLSLQCFVT